MEFKRFLQTQRESQGLSIKDLASKTGISPSYISQLEAGARNPPSLGKLRAIAEALNLPMATLMHIANKGLYTNDYLDASLNYAELHQQVNNLVKHLQESVSDEGEVAKEYNLSYLASSLESIEKQLHEIAKTHQPKKYPLQVESIIKDLLKIGRPGQEFVKRQIQIYQEFIDQR